MPSSTPQAPGTGEASIPGGRQDGEDHATTHPHLMRIAIPCVDGRLHGHFGGCREFVLVEVDTRSKRTLRTERLPAPAHQPGLFPRWLGHHHVDLVIAHGIGHRALDRFSQQGIEVRAGTLDATVDELVAAFLEGRLTHPPAGCDHPTHHHEHQDDPHPHHHHLAHRLPTQPTQESDSCQSAHPDGAPGSAPV